jgi:hypothetical protein
MISRYAPTNRRTTPTGPRRIIPARPYCAHTIETRYFPHHLFDDMISNKSIRYNESTQVDEKTVAADASYTITRDLTRRRVPRR